MFHPIHRFLQCGLRNLDRRSNLSSVSGATMLTGCQCCQTELWKLLPRSLSGTSRLERVTENVHEHSRHHRPRFRSTRTATGIPSQHAGYCEPCVRAVEAAGLPGSLARTGLARSRKTGGNRSAELSASRRAPGGISIHLRRVSLRQGPGPPRGVLSQCPHCGAVNLFPGFSRLLSSARNAARESLSKNPRNPFGTARVDAPEADGNRYRGRRILTSI
jgi:hypothetical protein